MRRRLLTALLLAAVPVAASAHAQSGVPGPARVKVADCSIDDASALFVAHMRRTRSTARMWLRFKLLEKSDLGFHPLKAPGLGRWRKSKPGVRAFAYKQAVRGLEAGSLYKAQVDFRWYDGAGRLVGTALRRSAPCRQFDLLPNLTAKPFAVRSLKPGELYRYRIVLTNEGVTAATGVPVRLTVNDTVVDTVVVASLPPAARKVVVIDGPACVSSVKVEVDPDGLIVESAEADNARELTCADLPAR
jgi:hypothetical protein